MNNNCEIKGYIVFTALLFMSFAIHAASVDGKENVLGESFLLAPSTTPQQKQRLFCTIQSPNEVHRYLVQCNQATFLDVSVSDCCIPGDHWEAKVKAWDTHPNTAVTTSPGPAGIQGVVGRVYNYGGTAANPGQLTAEVDCSYKHGVNVFPAGSTYIVSSDGFCTITDQGSSNEINRTP